VEAAVYLASRGYEGLVDVDTLRDSWHAAVCLDIEHGRAVRQVPEAVLERARSKTVSLAEAAEVLSFQGELPRFFSFLDQEENFIDAAMFRAVEWFGITGFEPWLKSLALELSGGPQYGIEHVSASWSLFFWCRSDLALTMAERQGLESWLWALINGPLERDKPWRYFWPERENPRSRDYVPMAGAILFVWHRIKPANMSEDVLDRASEFLSQTQMRCGGWPLDSDAAEPDLIATCFAIHGLALHQPSGWGQSVSRAAEWIWTQQQPSGHWYISGGPAVMLTVLALDALALAEGKEDVTFKRSHSAASCDAVVVIPARDAREVVDPEPVYNCTGEPWLVSEVPETRSVSISSAHDVADPRLAVIVATELELKYALAALSPLPRRRRVWKVTLDSDTFFLGRFGAFQCVLMLSSMSSQGPTGSTLSADAAIREWNPSSALLLGIAFGATRRKQLPADVLISEHVIPYEHQRVGAKPMFRNPVPPSSSALVNRFRHALDWSFQRPDSSVCSKHVGPLLSGDKLIDNLEFKNSLLDQYPNAVGGEMEGSGFWAAADRARKDWIIVKGVADWADGRKHNSYQPMAVASAVSLALHVFSDPHALDGV
jgi:nucleoside phosphorylase